MWRFRVAVALAMMLTATATAAACKPGQLNVHVLGSGGPEMDASRGAAAYAVRSAAGDVWLLDAGPGTKAAFAKHKLDTHQLLGILLTHLHVDHSADVPSFVKALYFVRQPEQIWLAGPSGNHRMPGTTTWAKRLFGTDGAWPYLADHLDGSGSPALQVRTQPASGDEINNLTDAPGGLRIDSIAVNHGPIPAVAWRLSYGDCTVVFSGDTSARSERLAKLAQNANLLVAHHAIPERARGAARRLHMPPSRIGEVARQAGVSALVLGHRMRRTEGFETDTLETIQARYDRPTRLLEDGDVIDVSSGAPAPRRSR